MSEVKFKQWFRQNYKGWMESFEPRRGTGMGIPDIMVLAKGRLVPLELKVAKCLGYDTIHPAEVRPDQIGWHFRFKQAGGISHLLIGMKEKNEWRMFLVASNAMRDWRHGYHIGFDALEVKMSTIEKHL